MYQCVDRVFMENRTGGIVFYKLEFYEIILVLIHFLNAFVSNVF